MNREMAASKKKMLADHEFEKTGIPQMERDRKLLAGEYGGPAAGGGFGGAWTGYPPLLAEQEYNLTPWGSTPTVKCRPRSVGR